VSATQFELDAVEAFALLKKIRPNDPVSILGFSLGSGIAAAIIDKIDAHRLILAGSFTSFRAAARSLGVPAAVTATLPQVWRTDESLKHCRVPVVIVHGARDRMFPVRMAAELAGTCGENAELVVVPDVAHNEPFYRPRMAFWGVIISRLIGEDVAG
jgi:pimeloyl-ACP methyl ester carboxylesterase